MSEFEVLLRRCQRAMARTKQRSNTSVPFLNNVATSCGLLLPRQQGEAASLSELLKRGIEVPVVLKLLNGQGLNSLFLLSSKGEGGYKCFRTGRTLTSDQLVERGQNEAKSHGRANIWYAEEYIFSPYYDGSPAPKLRFYCLNGAIVAVLLKERRNSVIYRCFYEANNFAAVHDSPEDSVRRDIRAFPGFKNTCLAAASVAQASAAVFCAVDVMQGASAAYFSNVTFEPGDLRHMSPKFEDLLADIVSTLEDDGLHKQRAPTFELKESNKNLQEVVTDRIVDKNNPKVGNVQGIVAYPEKDSVSHPASSGHVKSEEFLIAFDRIIKEKAWKKIFGGELSFDSINKADRKILTSYVEMRVAASFRIFADVVKHAYYLINDPRSSDILSSSRYQDIFIFAAQALTRLGQLDTAVSLLSDIDRTLPVELALINITASQQPAVALNHLEGLRKNNAPMPLSFKLLHAHLLSRIEQFDQAREVLNGIEAAAPAQVTEVCVAQANICRLSGDIYGFNENAKNIFTSNKLLAPRVKIGRMFSIGNIENIPSEKAVDGPLVSIIMTSFNSSATVRSAVESVLCQTYRSIELIIIDDVSSDETRDILIDLAAADRRIKLIFNSENMGTYASKNQGIHAAAGAFVTCHDSDDWMHPQRIETHVEFMTNKPQIIASRSRWVRIDDAGHFSITRWQKEYSHFNPASPFIRRHIFDQIGYFDEVRTGADSELWSRLLARYGGQKLAGINKVLSLGLHHEKSLTKAGGAAMNEEAYSLPREDYARNWLSWHRGTLQNTPYLKMKRFSRPFAVPQEIAVESRKTLEEIRLVSIFGTPKKKVEQVEAKKNVTFAISLASSVVGNWAHTCEMFALTLRSILGQSNENVRVIVCGHDRPQIQEMDDPRVEFLVSDIPRPRSPKEYRRDKMRKRRIIAYRFREIGGGYLMPIDADDLVRKDLVEYVLSDDNGRGYSIRNGFAWDYKNDIVAPVPGAWDATFDQICGSSAVFYFSEEDLPNPATPDEEGAVFDMFVNHAYWRVTSQELGRPLQDVPFPAAVYVVNHSQNISFSLQRKGDRTEAIINNIRRSSRQRASEVLKDFGVTRHAESKFLAV